MNSATIEEMPWIAGKENRPNSTRPLDLIEPAKGLQFAAVDQASVEDVDAAVAAARSALTGPWSRTSPTERGRLLHALADLVAENADDLSILEARNVGKAISSVKAEIAGAIETLRFYGSAIAALGGRSASIGSSLLTYSLKEPVGVCALIVPWNYPLLMTTWKLAPALAAGCTIVLKPASQTPLSALALARLSKEAGFPDGVLNVLPGPGSEVGSHLVSHPDVDKVAFTGSTSSGSHIMRLCSDPIKRLTLELGGKSPNIVFGDADLDSAVPSSCWSIFYAAGQSCEARSRILVQKTIYDEFVDRFVATTRKIVVGDPLDPKTHVGSLISEQHRDQVHGFVDRALDGGAELLLGGAVPDGDGAFYPPTILADAASDSEITQEEVFGPAVVIMPFEDEDEAARLANDTRYGLFATVWTGDPAQAHRFPRRIDAGMIGVNTPYTALPGIAFGGYKQSGFGRELSLDTLDLYSETKSLLVSTGTRRSDPFGLGVHA